MHPRPRTSEPWLKSSKEAQSVQRPGGPNCGRCYGEASGAGGCRGREIEIERGGRHCISHNSCKRPVQGPRPNNTAAWVGSWQPATPFPNPTRGLQVAKRGWGVSGHQAASHRAEQGSPQSNATHRQGRPGRAPLGTSAESSSGAGRAPGCVIGDNGDRCLPGAASRGGGEEREKSMAVRHLGALNFKKIK